MTAHRLWASFILSPLLFFLSFSKSPEEERRKWTLGLSFRLAWLPCAVHRTSWEQEFKRSVLFMNPSGTCHQSVPQQRTNSQKCSRVGKERRGPGDKAKEKETREEEQGERKMRREAPTSLRDIGVLSSSGRCCSRAKTMQLAMMVAKIMYSNGVGKEELRNRITKERRTASKMAMYIHTQTSSTHSMSVQSAWLTGADRQAEQWLVLSTRN